ncbi:cadherin-like domain-containing protein [Roseobacter sp. MH60115]|uniref:cadherin-like domain-containing protein n=1 Tax=Roseobacter sp. MH60115 TaxID=2785324 RepID=UPI0018A337AF|nr:cadherin-like domain-containing protein [Roseobacter sp. MH60115]
MAMKTPGVYVVEKSAFPNSVVQVATAVPAFIGYTQTAMNGNVSLHGTPWRITSMSEFHSYFGGAPEPSFEIKAYEDFDGVSPLSAKGADQPAALPRAVFTTQGPRGQEQYELVQKNRAFALYGAMRLFFQNGGGACYVTSIGTYDADEIDAEAMLAAIARLKKEPEPTMVVIPETTRLVRQNAVKVQQAMLKHCGNDMKNRFAILDMSGGYLPQADPLGNPVATFRNDIGINNLDFGAAYYPWLDSSIYQSRDFTFENIEPGSRKTLIGLMRRSVGKSDELRHEIERISAPVLMGDFTLSLPKGGTIALTTTDISASDDESDAEGLTYLVEGDEDGMAGKLVKTGTTDALTSFTQAQLEAGEVSFIHDPEKGNAGQFDLVVTDENEIATDARTIAVEVVGGLLDAPAVAAGTSVVVDVPADHPDGDKASVKLVDADTAAGKAKTEEGVGTWKVGSGGKVTFAPDPAFVGPEATVSYTIEVGGAVQPPQKIRILMNDSQDGVETDGPSPETIDKTLRAVVPMYTDVMNEITGYMNSMPASAAMAGIYTMVDNSRGVWKAPANVSLNSVVAPMVNISHEEQENLNVSTTGKSINAIRPFVGEGTLVWGARTLDGNSLDWRYINVRRTMIMIEESIRLASKAYVFEPNTAQTWVTMRSMIENFLTSVWKQGGLAGAVPTDAFSVHVGLGETMTPVDILEGILRITVLVAVTRPAEFIEITFQQQMQKS